MARSLGRSLGAMLILVGCTVEGGDDTNPFGDDSAGTSPPPTTTMAAPTSADEGTTAGSGSATGPTTTGTPTTGTPTSGDPSTSGSPADSSDGPTTMGDSSGGPGSGGFGECIGTGAWTSCAQYCEAVLEVCVQGGCDGSTVVYYGDVGSCSAMEAGNGAATPCAEPFAGGGGISFARCCCQ